MIAQSPPFCADVVARLPARVAVEPPCDCVQKECDVARDLVAMRAQLRFRCQVVWRLTNPAQQVRLADARDEARLSAMATSLRGTVQRVRRGTHLNVFVDPFKPIRARARAGTARMRGDGGSDGSGHGSSPSLPPSQPPVRNSSYASARSPSPALDLSTAQRHAAQYDRTTPPPPPPAQARRAPASTALPLRSNPPRS